MQFSRLEAATACVGIDCEEDVEAAGPATTSSRPVATRELRSVSGAGRTDDSGSVRRRHHGERAGREVGAHAHDPASLATGRSRR